MFDPDRFIPDCRNAGVASGPSGVLEVVAAAVAAPTEVLHALGEPRRAGVNVLYRSKELTILNLIWGPQMCQLPHDHRMWAVIGIYTGREDNIFWRRPAGDPAGRIEAAGAKALSDREAMPLGPDIIHSVINPIRRPTGAIHVYGGDFFAATHSQWTLKAFWKSRMTSSDCWRSSRNRTVYKPWHDQRHRSSSRRRGA